MDPVTLALAKSWAEGEFGDLRELGPHIEALLDSRIVEMGSNSNGEYVRWENGLQVCTGKITLTFYKSTRLWGTWTFPSAFAASQKRVVGPVVTAEDAAGVLFEDLAGVYDDDPSNLTNARFIAVANTGGPEFASGDTIGCRAIAIGRWK